jgi:hypothetical protein
MLRVPINRPARHPELLRNAVVAVLLAVLESSMTFQVHAERLPARLPRASTKVCTQSTIEIAALAGQVLTLAIISKISKITLE